MIQKKSGSPNRVWYLAIGLVVLAAVALSIGVAFAGHAGDSSKLVSEVDNAPLAGPPPSLAGQGQTPCNQAYLSLVPEKGAPCSGCTVHAGDKFTLDLVAHAAQGNVTAQQAYLGFSSDILQVVNADGSDCNPVSTVNADITMFDTQLQNEVCNGPQPCTLRGQQVDPGSIGYASGALQQCPTGCTGDIRAARVAFCAVKSGAATIRWQFAPANRKTQLVNLASDQMSQQSCYADYKLTVADK